MSAGSIASVSFQCTYISANEQYMTDLMCRTSDLVQRYSGTPSDPVIASDNDWTVTKPVLQVLLSSASPGMTEAALKGKMLNPALWYVNNVEITFGNDGLSLAVGNFPAGTFKRINANTMVDYPYGALQILKNVVTPLGGASGVLKVVFKFTDNSNNVITKEHTHTLGARMMSTDGYEVEVYTDGSMILTTDNPTVLLRARLFKGPSKEYDSKTMTSKVLRWYTYNHTTDDWAVVAAETNASGETVFAYGGNGNKELIVGRDGVPTYLTVMAAVYPAGSTETDYRKADATGTARINDQTDSLIIAANPTPADAVLRAGETTPDGVTFAPKTYDKASNQEISGVKYKFVCHSPAGTILNGTPSGTPGATGGYDSNKNNIADNTELLSSYKVPRAMFEAIGGGVDVVITAFKTS